VELQCHENTEVYEKSVKIIENYLSLEDDDHILTTSDTPQDAFVFSTDYEPEFPHGGFNFM
jgi:hypothetical protein